MTNIAHVLIVIPAHDEQRRIARALGAVSAARTLLPPSISTSLVVGIDSCVDDTSSVAARLLGPCDFVVETSHRCAGKTRRSATDAGLRRLQVERDRIWIANTDADSTVAPDWLTLQVQFATEGAAAVAGIVSLSTDECDPCLLRRFRRAYPLHDDGTHPHVHGANFGVRADAYLSVGGWPPLSTGEDQTLWAHLRAAGHSTVSSSALVVETSARLQGRAPDGFARDLASLASRPAA